MIRFSATLVALALGVLAIGVVTSRLLLVYVAIGGSALAFVCLGIGVALKRGDLFGESSRGTVLVDRGPAADGFDAEEFSPSDHASATLLEQPRDAGSAEPSYTSRHAFGQSGQAPDERVRMPAGSGRTPVDRPAQDWQEPLREWRQGAAEQQARRVEANAQRVSPQPWSARQPSPQTATPQAASSQAMPPQTISAQTISSQAMPPGGPSAADMRPPGGPSAADMRPPGGPPHARPRRPGPFGGESQAAVPPFGPQGPEAARPRQETRGQEARAQEAPRAEATRQEAPRQEAIRQEAPRQEAPRQEARAQEARAQEARAQEARAQEAWGQAWPEPPRGEPSMPSTPQGTAREAPRPQAPGQDRPAASFGGAARTSAPRPEDIPPPVEPIYPAGSPSAAVVDEPAREFAHEVSDSAPEPAERTDWFAARPQTRDERAVEAGAAEQPPAAAAESDHAREPAATQSATTERDADAVAPGTGTEGTATGQPGTDVADEPPVRDHEPGPAQDAGPAGAGDEPAAASQPEGDGAPADREVTIVPGVPRYHRPECILIRFMGDDDLQTLPMESAAEAGCTPCKACQPDDNDPASAVG